MRQSVLLSALLGIAATFALPATPLTQAQGSQQQSKQQPGNDLLLEEDNVPSGSSALKDNLIHGVGGLGVMWGMEKLGQWAIKDSNAMMAVCLSMKENESPRPDHLYDAKHMKERAQFDAQRKEQCRTEIQAMKKREKETAKASSKKPAAKPNTNPSMFQVPSGGASLVKAAPNGGEPWWQEPARKFTTGLASAAAAGYGGYKLLTGGGTGESALAPVRIWP